MSFVSCRQLRCWVSVAALLLSSVVAVAPAYAGATLDAINQRGKIRVGVGTSPGFFAPDSDGKWQASSSISAVHWR